MSQVTPALDVDEISSIWSQVTPQAESIEMLQYSVHPNFDIMEMILPMFGLFLIPLSIWYFFNPPQIHPLVGIPAKSIFLIRAYILLKPSVASSLTFGTHNHYFIQPGKYSHLSSYVLYNPYLLLLFSLLETPCSRPSYI